MRHSSYCAGEYTRPAKTTKPLLKLVGFAEQAQLLFYDTDRKDYVPEDASTKVKEQKKGKILHKKEERKMWF